MGGPSRKVPLPMASGATKPARRMINKNIDNFLKGVAHDAAQHIYDTMKDPTMPPDLRLRAAFDIMDRTQGKPGSKMDQKVIDEVEQQRSMPDLNNVPTEELERILEQLERWQAPAQIEGTVEEFDFDG